LHHPGRSPHAHPPVLLPCSRPPPLIRLDSFSDETGGRLTANLKGSPIDDAVRIANEKIVRTGCRLLYREGPLPVAASGTNVADAERRSF